MGDADNTNAGRAGQGAPDDSEIPPTPSPRRRRGFTVGNRAAVGRGRPTSSITSELRRLVDPTEVAQFLIDLMNDSEAPWQERVRACGMINDRLEGRTIARSMTVSTTTNSLPAGFFSMPAEARMRVLDDLRKRSLAGVVEAEHEHDVGDENDEDDDVSKARSS